MLHIICTVFERTEPIKILVSSFILQTNPDWNLTIVHDGPAPEVMKEYLKQYESDERIKFIETEKVSGYYGHPNRRMLLKTMTYSHQDFILITNDDNYYVPKFIEYMINAASTRVNKVGMVYCDTVHSYLDYNVLKTQLRIDYIDMGSFIVRADIAKRVGFNHINFAADGHFAIECVQYCTKLKLQIKYVAKPLFIHN
jgi:hypothetical protein